MLRRIFFICIYFFTWVVFFELARIFFLLSTTQLSGEVSSTLIFQSFFYGLKMDFSMAAYLTILICLFVLTGILIPFFRKKGIYIIYTGIILFIQLLVIVVDVEIYKAWGSRIDFTPLKYLTSPKEMWASISHLPLFWIFFGLLFIYLGFYWIFNRILSKTITLLQEKKHKLAQFFLIILFTGVLIIPIRGGFQLAPLNQSSVFFSNNQYANNSAINANWNFMYSLTKIDQLKGNPYEYFNDKVELDKIKPLTETQERIEQVVNKTDSLKPNVILIVWESFTEKILDLKIDEKFIVPGFRELRKEGIYFSNCYSSGDRTDKGISAIISSYPALPKGSIVHYPDKTAMLPGLGEHLHKNGFHTRFYYGGEPEFANIKSYLTNQKFEKLITKNEFSEEDMNSKWGVHDDVIMKKIIAELPQWKLPFFTTWLTLSSHEPYETPAKPFFKGNDNQTKFLNSLHYTDSVIYDFISELKKSTSWNNTLLIISADHGHHLPATGKRVDDFRIPVLWLGGALKKQNKVIDKTTSQLDIAASLLQQLGFSKPQFPFSKNLFDSSLKHWAFFTFNDGMGFVTDSSRLLFDNVGKRTVFEEGKTSRAQTEIAKAFMQVVYADFLKR